MNSPCAAESFDIFPLTEENPFRIELWDDEVDSIRSFDAESQRSIENLDEVHIYPACELVLTKEERDAGIARILAEAKQVSEKLRGEMKTEEAYRVKSAADQVAEEAGELGLSAGLDAYLSYFCEERVSLLDYFGKRIRWCFWMRHRGALREEWRRRPNFRRA